MPKQPTHHDPASKPVDGADAGDSSSSPATPPAAAVATGGYIKCALCNQIIDDEEEHMAAEHRHLRHLDEMIRAPLPSPLDATEGELHAVGAFAVAVSQSADRGPEAFRVMQRAQLQLHRLLDGLQGSVGYVYAFGSVVSMGCWDGVGDGDFAFIDPGWYYTPAQSGGIVPADTDGSGDEDGEEEGEEERDNDAVAALATDNAALTPEMMEQLLHAMKPAGEPAVASPDGAEATAEAAEDLNGKVIAPEREKRLIRNVTARLRDVGFRFDELDPVLHTRIPVVRRKRPSHDPLNLRGMQSEHLICFRFDRASSEEQFRSGRLHTLIATYDARELKDHKAAGNGQLILAVPDSVEAVHLMSRRERVPGVRKWWVANRRTPEIFAIDFDLSCRFHGIRNSWLLREYLAQDAVFRMGNVFLKTWSKACGINNSRVGFLTSYAVSVLWVYFLLRRGVAAFVDPSSIPVLPDPDRQLDVSYIPLWPPAGGAEAEAARTTRLGALLRDFFYFYGEEFNWDTQVVSIRQPCISSRDVRTKADLHWLLDDTLSLLLRERCYHNFSIEDVYEDNLDLGRHLTPEKAAWTRVQFRLAYRRCCGTAQERMRLLDVPRQRAGDVLRARLFETLLLDTDNAEGEVEEVVRCLCLDDDAEAGEDARYLLCAFELGSRLSDLWYDVAQMALDAENHKRYDRRADMYTKPVNPVETGEWAVVCSDALTAGGRRGKGGRVVRLEPPNVLLCGSDAMTRNDPRGAPKRQRALHLTKARNQYVEMERLLTATAAGNANAPPWAKGNKEKQAEESDPPILGLLMSKSAREHLYPHCFFPLQQHRLFSSYDTRSVFQRCLEDVAWEVARLHEVADVDADAAAILADRPCLLKHLSSHLSSIAAVLPHYAHVLRFVVQSSCHYIVFEHCRDAVLCSASPLLLRLVGSGGSASPQQPTAPPAPTAAAGAPTPAGSAPSYRGGGGGRGGRGDGRGYGRGGPFRGGDRPASGRGGRGRRGA